MKVSIAKRITIIVMSVWAVISALTFGISATAAPAQSDTGRSVSNRDLTIESGETITGDVTINTGDLTVYGTLDGKATVIDGNADIYGTITGDLTSPTGGNITLYEGSIVEGNIFTSGDIDLQQGSHVVGSVTSLGGNIDKEDGSKVDHSINSIENPFDKLKDILINSTGTSDTANNISQQIGPFARFFGWLGLGIFSAVVLFLALGLAALVPRRIRISSATLEAEPAPSVVVGIIASLLALPVFGIASLVLASTIVGIVLVPVLALAVMLAFLFGFVVVSEWLGKRLHEGTQNPEQIYTMRQSQSSTLVIEVLLGASVILASTVLPAIFLPFWITAMLLGVVYLVSCIGLGSTILSKFGTLQPRRHNHRRSVIYPTPVHNHYGTSLPHPPAHTQPLGPAPTLPREE